MKGIFLFVFLLLLLFLSIIIGSQNDQVITVNYIIAQTDIRVSSLMVFCLLLGVIAGVSLMGWKVLSARMRVQILQNRVKKLSKESNHA